MFKVITDKAKRLIEVELTGMMGNDEVASYIAEIKRQFIANRLREYVMVIDVTDMPIQTQDMVRAMGEHMASMPKAQAIAIVTGKSLARMQIRRLFTQPYARVVANVPEGRAWVLDGVEPATI